MKLTFSPPTDNAVHTYCITCKSEQVELYRTGRQKRYTCSQGHDHPRALIIDPAVHWWCDKEGEYWHQTAGVFLANSRGEFLFFERIQYPFGLTVPAGHVDMGEQPLTAALRELYEETNVTLQAHALTRLAVDDIRGDECRRGADAHRWHSFFATLPAGNSVRIDAREEGQHPVWLTPEEALTMSLTYATRYALLSAFE